MNTSITPLLLMLSGTLNSLQIRSVMGVAPRGRPGAIFLSRKMKTFSRSGNGLRLRNSNPTRSSTRRPGRRKGTR